MTYGEMQQDSFIKFVPIELQMTLNLAFRMGQGQV